MVNMHVLVCESNHASGKLIKYLLEGEARRTLQYSCVVDVVTGQYKKESIVSKSSEGASIANGAL